MKTIDLRNLQAAHKMLSKVIDLLVEEEDFDGDVEWGTTPDIDRTPRNPDQGVQVLTLGSATAEID